MWGTACGTSDCDNIVWGTTAMDADNIVWGTFAREGDNIVWGTMREADNIVWGTLAGETRQHRLGHEVRRRRLRRHRLGRQRRDDELDNIVWGTQMEADNIVWGTAGEVDNIVWGTSSESDNVTWGCSAKRHRLRQPKSSVFDGDCDVRRAVRRDGAGAGRFDFDDLLSQPQVDDYNVDTEPTDPAVVGGGF